jgi:hypothetical protein
VVTACLLAVLAASPSAATCQKSRPFVLAAIVPAGLGLDAESPDGLLVAAVWPDGRIVRARVASDPKRGHVEARLSEPQVAELAQFIAGTDVWTWKAPGLPPDVGSDFLFICLDGRQTHIESRDRTLSPPARIRQYLIDLPLRNPAAAKVPRHWMTWLEGSVR